MQDNDESLGTRHPIKPAVMGFPADKVTCRMQTFECSLLRPLEYICIFNFVARNFSQGVISSQSRYDRFDTSAYSVLLRGRSGTVQLVPIGCTAYYNSSREECQFSAGGNSRVHSRWGGGLWHGAGNTAVQKVCRILHNLPQNLLRKKERKVGENSKYLIVENGVFLTMNR